MPRTLTRKLGKPWPPAFAIPASMSAFSMVRHPHLPRPLPVSSSLASNHGIPEPVIEQALDAAKRFFALPLSIKDEVIKPKSFRRFSALIVSAARYS